jgi:hypothetical protein
MYNSKSTPLALYHISARTRVKHVTPEIFCQLITQCFSCSEDVFPEMQPVGSTESLIGSADYECSYYANQCVTWCRSLMITVYVAYKTKETSLQS